MARDSNEVLNELTALLHEAGLTLVRARRRRGKDLALELKFLLIIIDDMERITASHITELFEQAEWLDLDETKGGVAGGQEATAGER